MALIDAFVSPATVETIKKALKGAEIERYTKIRALLIQHGLPVNGALVDEFMKASSQAPAMRSAAEAVGTGVMRDVLIRLADKLEGR